MNMIPHPFFRGGARYLLLLVATTCYAANATANDFVLKDASGQKHSAVLLSASADIKVNGLIVFGKLKQKYLNNGPDFIAGEYVFPLPEGASINSLRVKVGGRIIDAHLKEKATAKAQFVQAKTDGKRAALLEQDRANLFRMAVANIPAGEQVEVELSYLDKVHIDNKQYSLQLPTTLTPRYNPAPSAVHSENKESDHDDALASFLNPIFNQNSHNSSGMPNNPISINVEMESGFALQQLHSDSHEINVQSSSESQYRVQLKKGFEAMDRDFVLQWQQNNTETVPMLYYETPQAPEHTTAEKHSYMMLNITPTAEQFKPHVLPKDITFIIDTSGSMGGESIRQAKAALRQALDILPPSDSFNVIEFNSTHNTLFAASQPANTHNVKQAQQFVENLVADGGTEMKPALLSAFRQPAQSAEHLKQVIFITDGAVGNEAELSQVVHQFIGDSRLFSIAIGSAPNQYLFRQLSTLGRGTSIGIDQMSEVSEQLQALFNKINAPAMRDIELVDADGHVLEVQPKVVPDVYYGEPLTLLLRTKDISGEVTVKAKLAQQPVSFPLQLSQATPAQGVAKLWGKQKISTLMDKIHLAQGDPEQLKQDVIKLSLEHNILSQYTSFVAIDAETVRSPEQALRETQIASLLPKGTAFPQTALGTTPMALLSLLSLMLAALLRWKSRRHPSNCAC